MSKLIRLFSSMLSFLASIGTVCLGIMAVLLVCDVILKKIGGSIPGAVAFGGILQAFMVFFGLAKAQEKKEHIQIDFFIKKLLPYATLRRYWDVVICIGAIIFFGAIFGESIDTFATSYQMKEYFGGATIGDVPI